MAPKSTDAATPPLYRQLVDDAGLFPPAELPMREALLRHAADEDRAEGVLSGRFVCPSSRLGELTSSPALSREISLCLVTPLRRGEVTRSLEQAGGDERLAVAALEGPLEELGALDEAPSRLPVFAELPLGGEWRAAHDSLGAAGRCAKVRCGGLRPELFPTARQLGGFVHHSARSGVAFKATAGLHHAVAHRDASTGFSHHGFLNLVLASCRALDGASEDEVVAVLEEGDPEAIVSEAEKVGDELAARARRLFVSYGSCSTSEPLEDLARLGLLAREGAG